MRRTLVLVVVTASLLGSPGLLDSFWSLVSTLWSEEGCGFDPWGECRPAPQPTSDIGCGLDPWGCPKGS
jgi:hypothetical protein